MNDQEGYKTGLKRGPPAMRYTIRTEFIYPPVPDRCCDWIAVLESTDQCDYDGDGPQGYGETEYEALAQLVANLSE